MTARSSDAELPACYALTPPGLEEVTADELRVDFRAKIKKTAKGYVVFRVKEIDRSLMQLRTAEDVFLFGWGTDELTYRAVDLESIRKWTDKDIPWKQLLDIHHAVTPKPKGKPTYRLVVQMLGEHGYRRFDALKALAKGVDGKLPMSWREAEENASVEIWLTIQGATALCGIRLSDRTMRHRTYKYEHFPASLRPPESACMARLVNIKPENVILDPMCGAGTLLAEAQFLARRLSHGDLPSWNLKFLGGDIDPGNLRAATANLRQIGEFELKKWDARRLPLENHSVDRILCNPPFGKQLSTPEEIGPLYYKAVAEWDRVLRPKGIVAAIVTDPTLMKDAIYKVNWRQLKYLPCRVLGQSAVVMVYSKDREP